MYQLTPEDKKSYLDSPYHCPVCGSNEIDADGFRFADVDDCVQTVTCECGACWKEKFELTDIELLNGSDPDYNQHDEDDDEDTGSSSMDDAAWLHSSSKREVSSDSQVQQRDAEQGRRSCAIKPDSSCDGTCFACPNPKH